MKLEIHEAQCIAEIERLATFSSVAAPAVTRIVFSDEDKAARAYFLGLVEESGFAVRVDGVGNTFVRWEGTDPTLPPVATGSHIDAIPNAGKYDGVVGVLGALEAFRALKRSGFQPRASLELILFTSEEPTLFGIGCLGSRLLSGSLESEKAETLVDENGKSLENWRTEAGFGSQALSDVRLNPGTYAAFVELHIEQGPNLEREDLDIGVVEKIAAPAALRVDLEGQGGHAGAVLMPDRRDAGLGAAEIALAVETAVLTAGSPDGVGTTGVFRIKPDAINSIPCRALLEIDLRDTDHAARQEVEAGVWAAVERIAAKRGLEFKVTTINSDPPALCASEILSVMDRVCDQAGFGHRRMISRAYHDTLFMARIAPVAMIFIPCHKGYSHRPDEYSSATQIVRGVQVLAQVLADLSR